jgi:hypothetical protein
VSSYETGEDMMEMRDGGHYTLAEVLQLPGYQDPTPMWRKTEVRAWLAARPRGRKNRPRRPGAKLAKTKGALLNLGLLLAFGFVDAAVAQQLPIPTTQPQPYYRFPEVRIKPETPPVTRVLRPPQFTPSEPVRMYPQYTLPPTQEPQRVDR